MVTEHRFASPQTNVTNHTNHTNQERTKRYDCIPLPTKSATASNPAAVRRFAEVFLAVHHQRLLAEEDPMVTFTTVEAQDWIQRAQAAIAEFLSVEPEQRTAFAVQLLLVRPSEQ